jgi:hypothetical protein
MHCISLADAAGLVTAVGLLRLGYCCFEGWVGMLTCYDGLLESISPGN